LFQYAMLAAGVLQFYTTAMSGYIYIYIYDAVCVCGVKKKTITDILFSRYLSINIYTRTHPRGSIAKSYYTQRVSYPFIINNNISYNYDIIIYRLKILFLTLVR